MGASEGISSILESALESFYKNQTLKILCGVPSFLVDKCSVLPNENKTALLCDKCQNDFGIQRYCSGLNVSFLFMK